MIIRNLLGASIAIASLAMGVPVNGQVRDYGADDQRAKFNGSNSATEANKRLVFDMWRTVLIARHVEMAEKFLVEDYRQHNPNIPTGRAALVAFVSSMGAPTKVPENIPGLIEVVGEGDLVVLVFTVPPQKAQDRPSTWFDMFRVKDGKIMEHWDAAAAK